LKKLRVLDLFSGIGGFSLGLERTGGFETVAFCEFDEKARLVLSKHWPDVPVYPDIKELTYERLKTDRAIDVVCGGFPCQPFSQAGKQRGKADDRDLWPEMFRIIKECQSTIVIGENVAGFINMELDRTVSDLEGEGYEVRVFVLGAVAVQAPHQRQRCWIIGRKGDVADSEGIGHRRGYRQKRGTAQRELQPEKRKGSALGSQTQGCGESFSKDVADSESERLEGGEWDCCREGWKSLPSIEDNRDKMGGEVRCFGRTSSQKRNADVADSEIEGGQRRSTGKSGINPQCEKTVSGRGGARDVADSECPRGKVRLSGPDTGEKGITKEFNDRDHRQPRGETGDTRSTFGRLGRVIDGFPKRLDGTLDAWSPGWEDETPRVTVGQKNRATRLKQLGNAVLPQVVEVLGHAILEMENDIGGFDGTKHIE
jgi:DNA (cytosine-5)-methyltransferase 1